MGGIEEVTADAGTASRSAMGVVEVPEEWLAALRALLAPLAARSEAEQYLLTGSPDTAIGLLAADPQAIDAFRLWGAPDLGRHEREPHHPLVKHAAVLPLGVLCRWAQVVDVLMQVAAVDLHGLPAVGSSRLAEAMFFHLRHLDAAHNPPVSRPLPFDHEVLERMLTAAGAAPSDFLVAAFRPYPSLYRRSGSHKLVRELAGYEAAVSRHTEVLRAELVSGDIAQRLLDLEMLEPVKTEVLRPFAPELAELATSSSKQVRQEAKPLFSRVASAEVLKPLALNGEPEQRLLAFELLWPLADAEARQWAWEQAAADRSGKIRALTELWSRDAAVIAPEAGPVVLPTIDWRVEVTDELMAGLRALWDEVNAQLTRPVTQDDLDQLVQAFEAGRPPELAMAGQDRSGGYLVQKALVSGSLVEKLSPVALTIMLNHFDQLLWRDSLWAGECYNELHRRTGRPSLLELSTILDQLGLDGPKLAFDHYCQADWRDPVGVTWPDEDIASFVLANLSLVLKTLPIVNVYLDRNDQLRGYQALRTLSPLPPLAVEELFALALGSRTADHLPAQQTLAGVPGLNERVATALKDGKADVRTAAARWLARLGDRAVVPALETAVGREKQDVTKGALLDALEALGQPIEKYLGRDTIVEQAAAVAAKGLPKTLDWLRWDALPPVRWADSGEAVPVGVLQWLAAQAVKAKSPEPNVMLRKYCAQFASADREALGLHLLEAWMAEDLVPDGTGEPAGSAIASKGLLALVAACAGEQVVEPTGRYLKEWYGQRAAQGRALIGMLGWVEHPGATQLMLSIGTRFRTKSFQEEATKQAEALAERRGWSIGELADRTIPTAGFEDSGVIELSYGERVFNAVLRPGLTIELRSPEGRPLSALPAPRQSEDEQTVQVAKKALTRARRELKAIVQLQTQRLYEALCTERTWPLDDWQRYLNAHPVMRHLTQRLAWVATTDDGTTVFRPLGDGTLTDVDDNEVKLDPDAVVAIAHDSQLDSEIVEAWQAHLTDYEVAPLFQQFGKGVYALPEKLSTATAVENFQGHLVTAFALRTRAGKLGYNRGETGDGGYFSEYEKRFPTLGLTTRISFTGNELPEQDRVVALTTLSFERGQPGGAMSPVRLSDVPAVLLSEAYGDLRVMAADGTGFDPDWERKSDEARERV